MRVGNKRVLAVVKAFLHAGVLAGLSQTRDHPVPETLPRPRDLPPAATGLDGRRGFQRTSTGGGMTTWHLLVSINALAETINGLYKTELIKPRKPWRTVEEVELATAEWIDWFNHRRLYEYCGDIPPGDLDAAHYAHQTAQHTAKLSRDRSPGNAGLTPS
jgi:hypothetical protein